MCSSKFSGNNRVQPLPPLCAKGPVPSTVFDSLLIFSILQGYVSWTEPGSPTEIAIAGTFPLRPQPWTNRWEGTHKTDEGEITLTLHTDWTRTIFALEATVTPTGQGPTSVIRHNIAYRSLDPFDTGDTDITINTPHRRVSARAVR